MLSVDSKIEVACRFVIPPIDSRERWNHCGHGSIFNVEIDTELRASHTLILTLIYAVMPHLIQRRWQANT